MHEIKIDIPDHYMHFINNDTEIKKLFDNCFFNTLNTTTELLEDGSTFVFTGDIPAMWLRDSSAQVRHYLPFSKENAKLQSMISGLIKRQIFYINTDPYANAFNRESNGQGHQDDITKQNPWIWERKYEIDSLCYPIQLAYLLWKETGNTSAFDAEFKTAAASIMQVWEVEQNHDQASPYSFERRNCVATDTLTNNGKGAKTAYTKMTWSGFRPSDDACEFGYLVPANMFAAVVLDYLSEIFTVIYGDESLASSAKRLGAEIREGIETHAIVEKDGFGKIYCYETDGLGNYNFMDDANVPSLLSMPYLGFCACDDPVYLNTRRFLLSKNNPYYYEGQFASGIGSPHTPHGFIWHIALCMQGLTSADITEIDHIMEMLKKTHGETYFMHEGFDPSRPANFTREWFAWANSLFSEFLLKYIDIKSGKQILTK